MSYRRPSSHVFLIAFTAIVGVLSLAEVGSACTTKAAAAPAACCVDRPPSACGCCSSGQTPSPVARAAQVNATISSPARIPHQASTPPSCECRESQPAAPWGRPAPRTTIERNDVQDVESFDIHLPPVRISPSPGHLRLPNESPPRFPLYLRTSRFLI